MAKITGHITAEKLIENAIAKGCDVSREYEGQIGIRYPKKFVWHWFKIEPSDQTVWFYNSYSQNTGKTHNYSPKRAIAVYNYLDVYIKEDEVNAAPTVEAPVKVEKGLYKAGKYSIWHQHTIEDYGISIWAVFIVDGDILYTGTFKQCKNFVRSAQVDDYCKFQEAAEKARLSAGLGTIEAPASSANEAVFNKVESTEAVKSVFGNDKVRGVTDSRDFYGYYADGIWQLLTSNDPTLMHLLNMIEADYDETYKRVFDESDGTRKDYEARMDKAGYKLVNSNSGLRMVETPTFKAVIRPLTLPSGQTLDNCYDMDVLCSDGQTIANAHITIIEKDDAPLFIPLTELQVNPATVPTLSEVDLSKMPDEAVLSHLFPASSAMVVMCDCEHGYTKGTQEICPLCQGTGVLSKTNATFFDVDVKSGMFHGIVVALLVSRDGSLVKQPEVVANCYTNCMQIAKAMYGPNVKEIHAVHFNWIDERFCLSFDFITLTDSLCIFQTEKEPYITMRFVYVEGVVMFISTVINEIF